MSLHAASLPPPLAHPGTLLLSGLVKGSSVYPNFQKNKHTQQLELSLKKKKIDKMNESLKGIESTFEETMAKRKKIPKFDF